MSGEANGRIRLTWPQIVWGIGLLGAIIGSWADMRNQNALNRQALISHSEREESERTHIWEAVRNVQAEVRSIKEQEKPRQRR